MRGKVNGVQAYVRQKHKVAVYVHCLACSLNLAISEVCSVAPIINCMTVVHKKLNHDLAFFVASRNY
jgi:hypothetical protein